MRNFAISLFALAALAAGCVTRPERNPVYWDLSAQAAKLQAAAEVPRSAARWATVRLTALEVRPPCDRPDLCVRRADGTWGFDALNRFADAPQGLLRGLAEDVLGVTGRFGAVVPAGSAQEAAVEAEIAVTDLSLAVDARGVRRAHAALALRLVKGGERLASARGEAAADVADGNFARAFSSAFAEALRKAAEAL